MERRIRNRSARSHNNNRKKDGEKKEEKIKQIYQIESQENTSSRKVYRKKPSLTPCERKKYSKEAKWMGRCVNAPRYITRNPDRRAPFDMQMSIERMQKTGSLLSPSQAKRAERGCHQLIHLNSANARSAAPTDVTILLTYTYQRFERYQSNVWMRERLELREQEDRQP